MNWNEIADNQEPFRSKVKEKWPLVTDDDLTAIAGERGPLVDLLQVRYEHDKAEVERELDDLVRTLKLVNIPELAVTGPSPASDG